MKDLEGGIAGFQISPTSVVRRRREESICILELKITRCSVVPNKLIFFLDNGNSNCTDMLHKVWKTA